MGRQPCCEKIGLKKGPWTAEEDNKLINFILTNGHCCWRALPKLAELKRCGKSCRLRWTNYLRPDLKRGLLSQDEENLVIHLHSQLGNRWSKIASHLPGRTDNEIKNYWNTHIKKKLTKMGIDPQTHNPLLPLNHQQQEVIDVDDDAYDDQNNGEHEKSDDHELPLMPSSSSSTTTTCMANVDGVDEQNDAQVGFCTDEVPMVELDDNILQFPSSSLSSSSSTSSSLENEKEMMIMNVDDDYYYYYSYLSSWPASHGDDNEEYDEQVWSLQDHAYMNGHDHDDHHLVIY